MKTRSVDVARPKRLLIDQQPHLINYQAINQRNAFSDNQDYQQYLHWLNKEALIHNCILHAYLLLPKQIYLVLEPSCGEDISKLMQALGRRYVRYLNLKEKLSGTLWKDRFKASPLQSDFWLKNTLHYLVYKPVSEGLCKTPKDYPWSSYRKYVFQQLSYLQDLKLPPNPSIRSQLEVAISRNLPLP